MTPLIQNIENLQKLKGLNDTQFAEAIGVDLSTWSKVKNGERRPSNNFLRGIVRAFPELHLAVLEEMKDEDNTPATPNNGRIA